MQEKDRILSFAKLIKTKTKTNQASKTKHLMCHRLELYYHLDHHRGSESNLVDKK